METVCIARDGAGQIIDMVVLKGHITRRNFKRWCRSAAKTFDKLGGEFHQRVSGISLRGNS